MKDARGFVGPMVMLALIGLGGAALSCSGPAAPTCDAVCGMLNSVNSNGEISDYWRLSLAGTALPDAHVNLELTPDGMVTMESNAGACVGYAPPPRQFRGIAWRESAPNKIILDESPCGFGEMVIVSGGGSTGTLTAFLYPGRIPVTGMLIHARLVESPF
jgi:hypothetical protein